MLECLQQTFGKNFRKCGRGVSARWQRVIAQMLIRKANCRELKVEPRSKKMAQ